MWQLKIPVKLLILPVILILGIFNVLGNVATKLSCYVFGPAMFLLFGPAFFHLTQHSWPFASQKRLPIDFHNRQDYN